MHPVEFQILSGCKYLTANDLAPGGSTYNSIREHDDAQQRTTDSRAIPAAPLPALGSPTIFGQKSPY
jgi:hypothetical protein